MKKIKILILMMLIFISVSGCMVDHIKINKDVLASKDKVLLIWKSDQEYVDYFRKGGQGLLEMAVSETFKPEWAKQVELLSIDKVIENEFKNEYEALLTGYGFEVDVVTSNVEFKSHSMKTASPNIFWADAGKFKDVYDADYIFYLEMKDLSLVQDHFGFIATSEPRAECVFSLFMVSTLSNEIVGLYESDEKIKMPKGWDQGPEYSLVMETVLNSFTEGIEKSKKILFSGEGG
jgi:hypothetical protein